MLQRIAFFAAAGLIAASTASAQDLNFSKIKCKDFISAPTDQIATILTWLEGYYTKENAPPILYVDKVVKELCWPVEIRVSGLSNHATVLGAVRLGVDFAMAGLLGEDSSAAFLYPGTLAEPVRQ